MGCCRGWPAPSGAFVAGANDLVEEWSSANDNWAYDGDEAFGVVAGYLSVDASASSTFVSLDPTQPSPPFSPFPRTPTGPYPFRAWAKIRSILIGTTQNRSLFQVTISNAADLSGDYVIISWYFNFGSFRYDLEFSGQKNGSPFDFVINSGILGVSTLDTDLEVIVTPVSYQLIVDGEPFYFESGFDFPTVALCEFGIQRHNANEQCLLGRTEIYTQAP